MGERRVQPALMATILARSIWVENGDVGGLETRPWALSACQVCANLLGTDACRRGSEGEGLFFFLSMLNVTSCSFASQYQDGERSRWKRRTRGREGGRDGGLMDTERKGGQRRRFQERKSRKSWRRREERMTHCACVCVCVSSQIRVRTAVFPSHRSHFRSIQIKAKTRSFNVSRRERVWDGF